jgi:hypothetical protein
VMLLQIFGDFFEEVICARKTEQLGKHARKRLEQLSLGDRAGETARKSQLRTCLYIMKIIMAHLARPVE